MEQRGPGRMSERGKDHLPFHLRLQISFSALATLDPGSVGSLRLQDLYLLPLPIKPTGGPERDPTIVSPSSLIADSLRQMCNLLGGCFELWI